MVARTICSRRSGPIPSLGVTPVFVSEVYVGWSTNYVAAEVCDGNSGRVKRGEGARGLLVPGPHDQAIRRDVAAVNAAFRRGGRAPGAAAPPPPRPPGRRHPHPPPPARGAGGA